MGSYPSLYLGHGLIFTGLGTFCISADQSWVNKWCDEGTFATSLAQVSNVFLAYTYFACAALAIIVSALCYYFKRSYLPPELGRLKRVMAILGVCQRLSWILLHLVHYALLCVIGYFWIKVFTIPECAAGTPGASN